MAKYIEHILFQEDVDVVHNDMHVPCRLIVSFMRYDNKDRLFFPIFIYSLEEKTLYLSVKYRLYPDGSIVFAWASEDCSIDILDQFDILIRNKDFSKMIPRFVSETLYSEVIPE